MSSYLAKNILAASLGLSILSVVPSANAAADNSTGAGPAVTITEDDQSYTLSNGIVTARALKKSGDIVSLQYKGIETLTDKTGHGGGFWSEDTAAGTSIVTKITIDPKS